MDWNFSRRKFFFNSIATALAGQLAAAKGAQAEANSDRQLEVAVVSDEPYGPSFGKPVKPLKASYVYLPFEDPVRGGADPFIALSSSGDVYATTATFSRLWKSSDGGRSWTGRKLDLDPPLLGRGLDVQGGVQSFGILKDDTFIIGYGSGSTISPFYVGRSGDLGKSWEKSAVIDPAPYATAGGGTHGFSHQLADGTILLPASHYWQDNAPAASALFIHRSRDGGKTWGDKSLVCYWGWEPSFLTLPSGRLLIAVRYQRCEGGTCVLPSDPPDYAEALQGGYPKQVYLAESFDGGYKWKHWRKVTTGDFDCPGDLVRLSDGKLVLLYAHRAPDPTPCGTWAMVSPDEGRSWERQRYIVNGACEQRPVDFGFCASAVLKDDTILTLSGCRGGGWPDHKEANQRNPGRIRAIRWRLE